MTLSENRYRAGVSAPHRLASRVGAEVLADGGTAIEAAVATAAALSVVYPHMNSIGGDSFWLIKQKEAAPVAVCACGQAAKAASIQWYKSRGCSALPTRGALAALTVPGTVRGWKTLLSMPGHRRHLSLKRILDPAILLAEKGFPVSHSLARTTAEVFNELKKYSGFSEVFLKKNGDYHRVGECLRQVALAKTLSRLAHNGLQDFYTGETAELMCRELQEIGSPLTAKDFEICTARVVEPLHLRAFGQDFYNLPEPTQGVASLAILGLVDRLAIDPKDTVAFIHAVVEATKVVFDWRNKNLGDPAWMNQSTRDFLSASSLDALAGRIDLLSAGSFSQKQAQGDTVWFGVADDEGTVVSCIQSIYWEYGSGIVLKNTGVSMQNRGCAFKFEHGHPNSLRPGALPFHTLNPAMLITEDGSVTAYGTMGGEGQPQTQAAVILRHLFGMPLEQAIAEPRWLIGRTWGDETAKLRLESRFDSRVVEELKISGHDVEILSETFSDTMGHAGAVSRDFNGIVTGASDPRCDGSFEAV